MIAALLTQDADLDVLETQGEADAFERPRSPSQAPASAAPSAADPENVAGPSNAAAVPAPPRTPAAHTKRTHVEAELLAERERVEELAQHLHDAAASVTDILERQQTVHSPDDALRELHAQLDALAAGKGLQRSTRAREAGAADPVALVALRAWLPASGAALLAWLQQLRAEAPALAGVAERVFGAEQSRELQELLQELRECDERLEALREGAADCVKVRRRELGMM